MNVLAPQFWYDEKVVKLGVTGKLLFAAMITDDRVNLPGLYVAGPEHFYRPMRPHLEEEVQSAFKLIVGSAMAHFDQESGLLRLPNVWKYAPAPTPNQIGGWKSAWLKTPDYPLRYAHLVTLQRLAYKGNKPSREAFDEIFGRIVEGDHDTYLLGRDYLKEAARARQDAKRASARDPSGNVSDTHTEKVFVLESREAEPAEPGAQAGRSGTATTTTTGASRGPIEGLSRASGGHREGNPRASGGQPEGIGQVLDIANIRPKLSLLDPPIQRSSRSENASNGEDLDDDFTYETDEDAP